jgi:hypothetical protein
MTFLLSGPIAEPCDAGVLGTTGAAENGIALFDAVPDDAATAVRTSRGECMNGTFK